MSNRTKLSGLLAALVLLPGHALANTGAPVLFQTVTGLVLALISIVIVETLAGVGLVLLILVAEVPMLSDNVYGETTSNLWSLALFVPLFFLSVAIELPVVRKMNKSVDRQVFKRAIILANAGSYLMMSAFLIARIIKREVFYGGWLV